MTTTTTATTITPSLPVRSPEREQPVLLPNVAPELTDELDRLETTEREQRDQRKQEDLARLRELARLD